MKRVLAIVLGLCLLSGLSVNADIDTIEGSTIAGGGEGGCSSGTVDTQNTPTDSNVQINETAAVAGQSFQVTQNGSLYSISLSIASVSTAADVAMRVGTSTDLSSSYLDESVVNVSGTGVVEFVFDSHPNLSTGTTYYIVFQFDSGAGDFNFHRGGDDYANGSRWWGYSTPWQTENETSTHDIYFIVDLCD
jgi:hypothetical protein